MEFKINKAIEILERTPIVLQNLLGGLSQDWTHHNEGNNTWSPFDIIGHLIHGEKTDWIPRMEIILSYGETKSFQPFDRFAQLDDSQGKTLDELLAEFSRLRKLNLENLRSKAVTLEDLKKTGIHPAFGQVSLSQLLSTWVVHDLNHLGQISRVMASQYKANVGPWIEYLGILQR